MRLVMMTGQREGEQVLRVGKQRPLAAAGIAKVDPRTDSSWFLERSVVTDSIKTAWRRL
jgi:hypothetical protein